LGGPSRLAEVESVLVAELARQLRLQPVPAEPHLTSDAGARDAAGVSVPA
jgi:hypothetical protein